MNRHISLVFGPSLVCLAIVTNAGHAAPAERLAWKTVVANASGELIGKVPEVERQALVDAVTGTSAVTARKAIAVLAAQAATNTLIAMLDYPLGDLHIQVIEALGDVGGPPTIPQLLKALDRVSVPPGRDSGEGHFGRKATQRVIVRSICKLTKPGMRVSPQTLEALLTATERDLDEPLVGGEPSVSAMLAYRRDLLAALQQLTGKDLSSVDMRDVNSVRSAIASIRNANGRND